MGGWRNKFIFLLVVYFAGFATAIYCLAPVPKAYQLSERSFGYSALKTDEFAQSFNVGMHKCLDISKDAARRLKTFMKQKLDDRNQSDG